MKFNWSLKTKLVALSISGALLLSASGFGVLIYVSNQAKNDIETSFDLMSDSIAHEIAAQFYERYGDVQAFALNQNVISLNAEKMKVALDQYVPLYGIYDLILVVDRKGNFVGSNSVDTNGKKVDGTKFVGMNFKDKPWFQAVMAEKTTDDKSKGLTGTYLDDWSKDEYQKLAFGEDRLGIGFASAVKDEKGNVIGVIMNRAGSKFVESEVQAKYESMYDSGYRSIEFSIFNKQGQKFVDYYPEGNGGKKDFVHNWDSLLNENFMEGNGEVAFHLKARTDGHAIVHHAIRGVEQVAGLMPIRDKVKMVDDVGWYAMIRVNTDEAFATVNKARALALLLLSALTIAMTALSYLFATAVSKRLAGVSDKLFLASRDSRDAANKIASQATELSEAATEQAAALQETMSAVDEIEATAEKNSDAANTSLRISKVAREAATSGKKNAESMMTAVSEILKSNEEMGTQIRDSNRQFGDIVRMINEIGNKTKVINEIVFQTRLLSFNASVEAARAGEAGKGFAVVAEEVGNLAAMSGKAAQEITAMLDESTSKVEKIVSESTSKMDIMMKLGKEKVAFGTKTAEECRSSLAEILDNVQNLDRSISEISTASKEQTHGIKEIAKAMGQLNIVTQQNSVVAQQSSSAAEQLNKQSEDLNTSVVDLAEIVSGHANSQVNQDKANMSSNGQNLGRKAGSSERGKDSKAAKVLKFESKQKTSGSDSNQNLSTATVSKVSGSEVTPAHDDPRFEDV